MPPRTARVISTAIGSLLVVLMSGVWGVWLTGAEQAAQSSRDALLARANVAELDTEYVAPPGDSLTHHTSGFAKTLCSAVFVTGLDAASPPIIGSIRSWRQALHSLSGQSQILSRETAPPTGPLHRRPDVASLEVAPGHRQRRPPSRASVHDFVREQ